MAGGRAGSRFERVVVLLATVAAALAGPVGVRAAAPDQSESSIHIRTLGFYPGFGDADALQSMEAQLGTDIDVVVQFGERRDPEGLLRSVDAQLSRLSAWIGDREPLYSVAIPLAFGDADARSEEGRQQVITNLQATAEGAHDIVYDAVAVRLVEAGLGDAVIRLGHEFDGDWYPWSAQPDCAAYVSAFRRVVDVFRWVSPEFRFDWTGTVRRFDTWSDCAYPGDGYVDIVGLDVFDKGGPMLAFSRASGTWRNPEQVWQEQFLPGLEAHLAFAVAHGKPVSFPEWGLVAVERGAHGGDNPVFIRSMAAWLRGLPTDGPGALLYHSYFLGREEYDIRQLPNSFAVFLEEFAGSP